MRQNDEIIKIAKVYFKDIEQKFDAGSNLYIAFRNQTIILKKSGLSQGSVFYSLYNGAKGAFHTKFGAWHKLPAWVMPVSICP